MKKVLTLAMAVFLIFGGMPRKAHAWESLVTVLPTPLAVGTTLAPAILFAVIATGTHFPLCDVNGVTCEFTYPGDKPVAQTVALSNKGFGKPYHQRVNGHDTIRSDGE